MGLRPAFLLLVRRAALHSHEVRLLLAATRRFRGHGLTNRHDVVLIDVLCGERQEDSYFDFRVCHCADYRQYGDDSTNYLTVRTKSVPRGLCSFLNLQSICLLSPELA